MDLDRTGQDPVVRPHHDKLLLLPEDQTAFLSSHLLSFLSSVHSVTHSLLTLFFTQSLIQCFSHSLGPTLFTYPIVFLVSAFASTFQPACICIAFRSNPTTSTTTIQRPSLPVTLRYSYIYIIATPPPRNFQQNPLRPVVPRHIWCPVEELFAFRCQRAIQSNPIQSNAFFVMIAASG